MSFQKCPICQGSGSDPFIVSGSLTSYPCPTCKGARIIDEVTGLPPIIEEKHNFFKFTNSNTNSTATQHVSNIQTGES